VRLAYAGGVSVARAAAAVLPAGESKVRRALHARRGVVERWEQAARRVRDGARPLVWLHAPSVGEGLQARPVLQALRAAHRDWQFAYSFFSPSAERFAAGLGADMADYLPFDSADAADRLLRAVRPDALVFVKLDVWPVLVARAQARRVPVGLVSATLAPTSGRQGAWSRALLHEAYAALDVVGAIDAGDAQRLRALGVRAEVLQVSGDTRFDQVAARAAAADLTRAPLTLLHSARPTLVAGSTWPADEAVLLPAWEAVRARVPDARLVLAPHEPTATHLDPLVQWAAARGITLERLTALEASHTPATADIVLVDRVGVLGDLYGAAQVALVGGGFHAAGLHSVIEPAAFGVPVLFGPQHHNSREASLLLAEGGARIAGDVPAMTDLLATWLGDRTSARTAGDAGRVVVQREVGATTRSAALVEALVAQHRARRDAVSEPVSRA